MREKSREIAFCGILSALATAIMMLGGLIPAATYCCPILSMVVLIPVLEEFGFRMAWAAYGAVAVLSLLLSPDKEMAAIYVFFGYYPLLLPALNRIPLRILQIVCKLAFCNLSVFVLYTLFLNLFQLEAVAEEFAGYSRAFLLLLLIMGNGAFLLLDMALQRMTLLWKNKLRKRFLPHS